MIAAFERLQSALREMTGETSMTLAVTPETLYLNGIEARGEGAVAEVAGLLHQQHVLQLRLEAHVPVAAVRSLLEILKMDEAELQNRGGPASVWAQIGHPSIGIRQIDYGRVLQEGTGRRAGKQDDLWRSIVESILDSSIPLDEGAERRLVEIASDADSVAQLAADVMDQRRAADGSPMISTQAAAVLSSYRQLMSVVATRAPERLAEVKRNLAAAAGRLDHSVAAEVLRGAPTGDAGGSITKDIATSFTDEQAARLLAMTLELRGQDSNRLADVFGSLAPDPDRRDRILGMTKELLIESLGESERFRAAWGTMEELVVNYNDSQYTDTRYQATMNDMAARAAAMSVGPQPEELGAWLDTVREENVRRLSVMLMLDLLRIEVEPARAIGLIAELGSTIEQLMLGGEYGEAADILKVLSRHARHEKAIAHDDARRHLTELAESTAFREATNLLDTMDEAQAASFSAICHGVGPGAIGLLLEFVTTERGDTARGRAIDIIGRYGQAALPHLDPLRASAEVAARRALAQVFGRIGGPEGVKQLQPLLRSGDARVVGEAVRALLRIDDPSAGRSLQTLLRSAAAEQRAEIVGALVEQPERRTVPVLLQLLEGAQPLGEDHTVVLDALHALERVGDERAVDPIARVMRCRSLFARSKARAVKQASVAALAKIGSARARTVLQEALRAGDRALRTAVRERMNAGAP
jgi:HEAT repeat protein